MTATTPSTPAGPASPSANAGRRRALLVVVVVFAIAAVGVAVWWLLVARWRVTTDNAYVGGNVVQVSSQVAGTVVAVMTDDTQLVRQGQTLVTLDDADARVRLQVAQADLADAVRGVRAMVSGAAQSTAAIAMRTADVQRSRDELAHADIEVARTRADYDRREGLASQNFISRENVQNARLAWQAAAARRAAAASAIREAQAALAQAVEQHRGADAMVDDTTLEGHPRVMSAAARVREAYLALARATIMAPVTGHVARRSVQLGKRIDAGDPLLAIVPADQLWVDANFKEAQLRDVRIGQPVRLDADLYGDGVSYRGTVVGLGAGTGGAFALLPAQNASGNWIKVVQRVPVRIALDPSQLREHPLRIGLSMQVAIDIHDTSGAVLATTPQPEHLSTQVYAEQAKAAETLIADIIAANRGRGTGS